MIGHSCRSGNRHSIRHGSWFSHSNLSIPILIYIVQQLGIHVDVPSIALTAHVPRQTVYGIAAALGVRMAK